MSTLRWKGLVEIAIDPTTWTSKLIVGEAPPFTIPVEVLSRALVLVLAPSPAEPAAVPAPVMVRPREAHRLHRDPCKRKGCPSLARPGRKLCAKHAQELGARFWAKRIAKIKRASKP